MKFRSMNVLVAVFLLAILLTGCSVRVGDFTLWSSKNADLGQKFVKVGRFEGTSKTQMILIIPLHIGNLKEAVDRTIEAGGGEVLTNCVLFEESLPLFLYTESGYRIEGDVWKKASMSDMRNPGVEVYELTTLADGRQEMVSTKDLTKTEKVFNLQRYARENNIPAVN